MFAHTVMNWYCLDQDGFAVSANIFIYVKGNFLSKSHFLIEYIHYIYIYIYIECGFFFFFLLTTFLFYWVVANDIVDVMIPRTVTQGTHTLQLKGLNIFSLRWSLHIYQLFNANLLMDFMHNIIAFQILTHFVWLPFSGANEFAFWYQGWRW